MNDLRNIVENLRPEISESERAGILADLSIQTLSETSQWVLRHCVILHWFDKDIVATIAPNNEKVMADKIIKEILSLPFIFKAQYGVTFHKLSREGLINLYVNKYQNQFIECAQKVAPIFQNRGDEASLVEAFYCFIVAGKYNQARRLKNEIVDIAMRTRGDSFDYRLLNLQDEAEKLPFVEREVLLDILAISSINGTEWVNENLLPKLARAKSRNTIEYIESKPDDKEIRNVQFLAKHSKTILVVLTKDWEELSGLENIIREISAENQPPQLIPLIVEGHDIPIFLKGFAYLDFTKKNERTQNLDKLSTILELGKQQEIKGWFLAHPYGLLPHFTGRATELSMLTEWINKDRQHPMLILRALGGSGKSSLSWYWLTHYVDTKIWSKVVWWSFYEGDSSFDNFLKETLAYLNLDVQQNQRRQVEHLLRALQKNNILLIMDGFERALRAYSSVRTAYQGEDKLEIEANTDRDCINSYADWFLKNISSTKNLRGKVLITTRLTPRAVENNNQLLFGCREEQLSGLQREDAVEFFRAMGIKGTSAEIENVCALYGFHPLSLRLLAGRIIKDPERPGDIVVSQKLQIDGVLKQRQHHVVEIAFNSLPPYLQTLLSTIACFRSSVPLETLRAVVGNKDTLETDLAELIERGLLHFDESNRKYDLHPIVQRYAYQRLSNNDLSTTHSRLSDYFAAIDIPSRSQTIDDLAPIIELYHHTVRAGNYDEALRLFYDRLNTPLYYQFGAYETIIELLRELFIGGDDQLPHLKDEATQTSTLDTLANAYTLNGQPRRAVQALQIVTNMVEKTDDKRNLAISLGNAAVQQLVIGNLRDAEINLRQSADLSRKFEDRFNEGISRQEIGRLLVYRAAWEEAEAELAKSYNLFEKQGAIQSQCVVMAYRTFSTLMMSRDPSQLENKRRNSAIEFAERALALAEEAARARYPFERDFIRAHWLFGAAYRLDGQLDFAEQHLSEALTRDRSINLVEMESDILLDLARLRYAQKNYEEAKSLADEALTITERCGYVLQGADVNLFLAQYALEQEKDKSKAKQYAEEAKKLATCDGPPYYYKVAYEEAERMLEKL